MAVQAPNPTDLITLEGTIGTNDNDVVYLSEENISRYDYHIVQCIAGTVEIDATVDGTNWVLAISGRDVRGTALATYVREVASGGAMEIPGRYKRVRVLQKGATASNAVVSHARNSRGSI